MTEQLNKQWDGLTISGELTVGVYFAGTRHKRYTLRVGVAGDWVSALEEYPNGPFHLHTIAVFRRQLLSLGEIPTGNLTTELLREALTEIDLAVLAEADIELGKKLAPPSAATPTGGVLNTPLSDTVTG